MVTIIITVALGIVAIVLALKLIKKKKPVWARNTRRIIGVGTDASPELKMTFHGLPVDDVYKTVFIFFNRGTETIRKIDVAEAVAIHFKGAKILRPPTILATNKGANKISVRHIVKDGDEAVEVDFLYLDHGNGVVVEVFHTKSEKLICSGIIMGVNEIRYIGEFLPYRPPRWLAILYALLLIVLSVGLYMLFSTFVAQLAAPQNRSLLAIVIIVVLFVAVSFGRFVIEEIPVFYRYLKFPKWTGFLKLPLSDETKLH